MNISTASLCDGAQAGREQRDAPCSISILEKADESRWDDFVLGSEGGTFYHLAGWRSIFESQFGHRSHYLLAESDGEILAVLPLVHVRSLLFGNALISVPFLVYGGPVSRSIEAERAIVDYACELAGRLGVDHLELRNQQALKCTADEQKWQLSNTHVTFRKVMDADPDANLKSIPRKQRAMIRKGEQAVLTWQMDDDVSRLYPAMLECKRNLGTPFFGRGYLQAIKNTFTDSVEILTVVHGKDAVCSVMSFRFRDEILPYYGGGGDLARVLKGNDFMYWCVMEKACKEGVRIFDYGRSAVGSGAYRFKKHWGFEPEPLAYQYYLVRANDLPNLNPSNPKYSRAISLWKRLPVSVAGLIGPPIAARLG